MFYNKKPGVFPELKYLPALLLPYKDV